MTSRLLRFVTFAGACFTLMTRAQADVAADTRKIIQAAYDKENAAMAKKDLNGTFSSVMPDFVATDKQGHQAFLRELKPQMQVVFQNSSAVKATTTIQKFTFKGNRAIVIAKNHIALTLLAPKGGKPSHAVIDNVEEDLWVKNGTKWVRRTANMLSQTMMKDGKPFGPR